MKQEEALSRYAMVFDNEEGWGMLPDPDGEYVKFDDVKSAPTGHAVGEYRYEIQNGPDGEANYAWLYHGKEMVATMRVHHAMAICASLSAPPAPAREEEIERLTEERGDEWLFRTVLTEYQICQPALIDVLVPTGYEWGACQTFMDRYDLMKRRVRLMFEVYRVASGQSDGGPHGGLLAETIGSVDLNPLALELLKKHQRPLDIDGDEVGVSRQALHELLASYTFLIVERDSKKERGA